VPSSLETHEVTNEDWILVVLLHTEKRVAASAYTLSTSRNSLRACFTVAESVRRPTCGCPRLATIRARMAHRC